MLRLGCCSTSLLASVPLAFVMVFTGCSHDGHPDDKMAVYNTLNQHDLSSVNVAQDRDAGTITLSGIVGSGERKRQAEQLAQQAAPGYSIVDRIQVQNAGLASDLKAAQLDVKLDSAIERHYKATLAAHKDLRHVQYSAYNQTLTLKGSVKTYEERQKAEDLAKKVPQVQHVVNEIQLSGSEPTPASS